MFRRVNGIVNRVSISRAVFLETLLEEVSAGVVRVDDSFRITLANPSAQKLLGWEAKRDLPEMLTDAWNWQSLNPRGYGYSEGSDGG